MPEFCNCEKLLKMYDSEQNMYDYVHIKLVNPSKVLANSRPQVYSRIESQALQSLKCL
jgi:hypothetical protein